MRGLAGTGLPLLPSPPAGTGPAALPPPLGCRRPGPCRWCCRLPLAARGWSRYSGRGGVLEGSPAALPSLRAPPSAEAAPVPVPLGGRGDFPLVPELAKGSWLLLRAEAEKRHCLVSRLPRLTSLPLPFPAPSGVASSLPGSPFPAAERNSDHAGLYSGLSLGGVQVNKESPALL